MYLLANSRGSINLTSGSYLSPTSRTRFGSSLASTGSVYFNVCLIQSLKVKFVSAVLGWSRILRPVMNFAVSASVSRSAGWFRLLRDVS
jgi:hypothetical protein